MAEVILLTAMVSLHGRGAEPTVVSFEKRGGRVMVPVSVNGSASRLFLMDTGFNMTFLSAEQAAELGLNRSGQVTIAGIAGDEEADVFEGAEFRVGESRWSPRRVAAFPAPSRPRLRKRPGVLGSGFFRRFVVEVDSKQRELRLHEPESFQHRGRGEVVELEFRRTTPSVRARIVFPGHDALEGRFEIDSGCDGGLCLGQDFVGRHDLVALAGKTRNGGRAGVGGDVDTLVARVPEFFIGQTRLVDTEANFFLKGSPVRRGYAGHVGSEVLNQFKVIYDYSREQMILVPYDE